MAHDVVGRHGLAWVAARLLVVLALAGSGPMHLAADTPPLDFPLLAHLAEVYRCVRFDPGAAVAQQAWELYYEAVIAVDLPQTENRYLIGTLRGGMRQEIVVRGTANFRNAVFDAEVEKSWNGELGCRLHVGFERMALAVYRDVKPRLVAGADLVVFGHSLGAAEAVILGMLLVHDGCHVSAIYASGQPKVTDQQGAELWASLPVLRISCEGDPIPFLPPRTAVSREPFVHFGQEILLLPGRSYARVQNREAAADRLTQVWQMLKTETPREAIALHLFPHYYELYQAKADGATEVTFGRTVDPLLPSPGG